MNSLNLIYRPFYCFQFMNIVYKQHKLNLLSENRILIFKVRRNFSCQLMMNFINNCGNLVSNNACDSNTLPNHLHDVNENISRKRKRENPESGTFFSHLIGNTSNEQIVSKRYYSTLKRLTNDELSRCDNDDMMQKFLSRIYTCKDLNYEMIGTEIKLFGWLDKEIKHNKFVTFKDGFGSVLLILPNGKENEVLKILKDENITKFTVEVTGILCLQKDLLNSDKNLMAIALKELTVLNSMKKGEFWNKNNLLNGVNNSETQSEPLRRSVIENNGANDYTTRTHTCGELRASDVGKKVKLCGWVRYNRLNRFILIGDTYGITQIIFNVNDKRNCEITNLSLESVLSVTGIVCSRPTHQINPKYATGEIEVVAETAQVFNKARDLPFLIRDYNKRSDQILNRYRYLVLRYPDYQYILRLRSEMVFRMREFLITKKSFVEVETPTLFKKTPGGAQEFVVPTKFKNKFYSLVQSPQQLKQLLMVASIDRYFQIARCYRDEKSQSERQPEFTQLDMELSFTNVDGVIKLTEDVLAASWPDCKNSINVPFRRISYKEAIQKYGSDKPCLFDKFLLQNMQNFLEDQSEAVYMFVVPNALSSYKELKSQCELVTMNHKTKIFVLKILNIETLLQELTQILPSFKSSFFKNCIPLQTNDLLVLAKSDNEEETLKTLGRCRHVTLEVLNIIQEMNEKGIYDFAWVVDFPLFEMSNIGELKSVHHPFTQPHPEDVGLIPCESLKARSLAYDLVLNGCEIGGGSIRIHNAELQETIFKVLGMSEEDFAHLLEAFRMGCPPHGGIALGIDRIIAIICARRSIKDVIAFPKSAEGLDFMSVCPSDIPLADKIRYNLKTYDDESADSPQSYRVSQETEEEL